MFKKSFPSEHHVSIYLYFLLSFPFSGLIEILVSLWWLEFISEWSAEANIKMDFFPKNFLISAH